MREIYQTSIEQAICEELESRDLRKGIDFCIQFPIRNSFILDFAFPDQMVAIETDGPIHETAKQRKWDVMKDHILKRLGWTVLRLNSRSKESDVEHCVDRILELVG